MSDWRSIEWDALAQVVRFQMYFCGQYFVSVWQLNLLAVLDPTLN